MITLRFNYCDGPSKVRVYKSLKSARKAAHAAIGAHPDLGSCYAVGMYGDVTIEPDGCTLQELFPNESECLPKFACSCIERQWESLNHYGGMGDIDPEYHFRGCEDRNVQARFTWHEFCNLWPRIASAEASKDIPF